MRLLVAIFIPLILLAGCTDDPVSPPSFTGGLFAVSPGQTISLPGTGISLMFEGIPYDGRLPAGQPDTNWWYNTVQTRWKLLPSGTHLDLYLSGEVYDSVGFHFSGDSAVVGNLCFRLRSLFPLPPALLQPPETALVATIEITQITPSGETPSTWLPMTLGNRWIYLDSTFENDSLVSVTFDTIQISSKLIDQHGLWSEWSQYIDPFGRVALIKGDTIYSQQIGYGPMICGNPLYNVTRELRPPVGDSMQYLIFVDGDMISTRTVVRMSSPVATPAGEFSGCLKFDALLAYTDATEILAPHIGFVFMGRVSHYSETWSGTTHMWLQSYELH